MPADIHYAFVLADGNGPHQRAVNLGSRRLPCLGAQKPAAAAVTASALTAGFAIYGRLRLELRGLRLVAEQDRLPHSLVQFGYAEAAREHGSLHACDACRADP